MDIAKFTLKTAGEAAVRVGAGASGTAFLVSLAIATARNAVDSCDHFAPRPAQHPQGQNNPNGQAQQDAPPQIPVHSPRRLSFNQVEDE